MEAEFADQVYLCPRCLEAQESPGVCPRDGAELVTCRPGNPDDPCRRPLIDVEGRVVSRAPIWWLRYSVRDLLKYREDFHVS